MASVYIMDINIIQQVNRGQRLKMQFEIKRNIRITQNNAEIKISTMDHTYKPKVDIALNIKYLQWRKYLKM